MQQCSALSRPDGTASGLPATTSPGRAAYNREGDMGQRVGFVKGGSAEVSQATAYLEQAPIRRLVPVILMRVTVPSAFCSSIA